MRDDEKFLSFDLFFSLFENEWKRENFHKSDLENERQNLSLIQKNRRRQKFCSKNKKFRSFDQKKFKKTANEFFLQQTEERKQRKNSKKKKSVGKELDTSLCCAIDLVTALT